MTHAHAVAREASQTTEGFTAQDACKAHQLFAPPFLPPTTEMAERPREAWAQFGIISSFSILNA